MGDQDHNGERQQLPAAYWWSVAASGQANLYCRYGWVATVTPTEVRIGPDPPLYDRTRGPCRGADHGRRIVERILAVRLCLGPPERRRYREQLRLARIRRLNPLPRLEPEEDEDWKYP